MLAKNCTLFIFYTQRSWIGICVVKIIQVLWQNLTVHKSLCGTYVSHTQSLPTRTIANLVHLRTDIMTIVSKSYQV